MEAVNELHPTGKRNGPQSPCRLHAAHSGPHWNRIAWYDDDGNEVPALTREEKAANCPHDFATIEVSAGRFTEQRPTWCIYCEIGFDQLRQGVETVCPECGALTGDLKEYKDDTLCDECMDGIVAGSQD
jgi:predicted RNA-binding Zn-ribbon protein involved in translation (DUF1610 family)